MNTVANGEDRPMRHDGDRFAYRLTVEDEQKIEARMFESARGYVRLPAEPAAGWTVGAPSVRPAKFECVERVLRDGLWGIGCRPVDMTGNELAVWHDRALQVFEQTVARAAELAERDEAARTAAALRALSDGATEDRRPDVQLGLLVSVGGELELFGAGR